MAFGEFVYLFLMFFVPLFLIIIALGQLVEKDKEFVHYIFSLSFIAQGLWEIQIILYSTWAFPELYWLIILIIPVSYLVTPLILIRYIWIFSTDYRFYKRYLILLVPSVISAVFCVLPLVFTGIDFKQEHLAGAALFSEAFFSLPSYSKLVYLNLIISKIFFLTLISMMIYRFYMISRYSKNIKLSGVFRVGYVFAVLMVVMAIICITGDLFSLKIVRGSVFVANVIMCSVYIVSRRHPSYNRMLKIEIEKTGYVHSCINGLDIDSAVERLYTLMRDEKLFRDEGITLKKLADELGITSHQLSQILNERIKKNFNTFINEFRIEEAKGMLTGRRDMPILAISLFVGFNSYTTFNTTFSKMTGVSPSRFRRDGGE